MDPLPKMPSTGLCLCGQAVYFVRPERIGDRAYFLCERCGRRYSFHANGWEPGAAQPSEP